MVRVSPWQQLLHSSSQRFFLSVTVLKMEASKRLEVLQKHLASEGPSAHVVLAGTASRGASLPRFDIAVMEACLDDLASLKEEVYEIFRHRPDLLPASLEGLSKGVTSRRRILIICSYIASHLWSRDG